MLRQRPAKYRIRRAITVAAALAVASPLALPPASASASTTVGGVKRCAGGPTNYVYVYVEYASAAWTVSFHNLLKDGPGVGYTFTYTGLKQRVWSPYHHASWQLNSMGDAYGIRGRCKF